MDTRSDSIGDFREAFAAQLAAYLKLNKIKRFEFGNTIGWSSSGVSAALTRPREKCTERFIRDVSRAVPEFAGEFAEYRRIEEEAMGVGATARTEAIGSRAKNLAEKFREISREAAAIANDLESMADDSE